MLQERYSNGLCSVVMDGLNDCTYDMIMYTNAKLRCVVYLTVWLIFEFVHEFLYSYDGPPLENRSSR